MNLLAPVRALVACTAAFCASGCALIMPVESRAPVKRYAAAEYTWQALNVIDYGQTMHLANSERTDAQMAEWERRNYTVERSCYQESNFLTKALIGEHPSEASVALSSIAFALAHYYVSAWLESKDTLNEAGAHNSPWVLANWAWHGVGLATKAFTVASNHSIGLRVGGKGCNE